MALLLMVAASGCVTNDRTRKLCTPDRVTPPVDWITISGTSLPTCTYVVGEYGQSLADTLILSRTMEKLNHQAELTKVHMAQSAAKSFADSDETYIESLLMDSALDNRRLDTVVDEMTAVLNKYSDVSIPENWADGFPEYAFDQTKASDKDRQLLAVQVQGLEHRLRGDASGHLRVLFDSMQGKGNEKSHIDSRAYLKMLATDGKLNLDDHQKLKAWCYAQYKLRSVDPNESESVGAKAEKSSIASSFFSKKVEAKAASVSVIGVTPVRDTIMVLVHRRTRCVAIPLPLVFETQFGGYWVEAGDHLVLAMFQELPFGSRIDGEKNVGITGLVRTQGVWPNVQQRLVEAVNEHENDVDVRANMLVVSQSLDQLLVQAMLPYNMSSLSPARRSQMEDLIRDWGLFNGQVIEFQNTGVSPLLIDSSRKLQHATDFSRKQAEVHIVGCQIRQSNIQVGGTNARPESKSSISSLKERVPYFNDACESIQDAWSTARETTSDALGLHLTPDR